MGGKTEMSATEVAAAAVAAAVAWATEYEDSNVHREGGCGGICVVRFFFIIRVLSIGSLFS
jgi:hypothetical protein